jgi:CelD/BcsL family acetyltransferase involved in cellulose biosynthesis
LLNISILNPIEHPDWDELLLTADRATFFHTTAWARVLSESYGYKPLYFATIDNGKLAGLIPVMEIESFLTGKRGVSLPFTDICHPIADTDDIFQALMERLTQHGKSAGWKYIEIKGGSAFLGKAAAPCAEYVTHLLDLGTDENALQKTFRDSTRRNIRKAYREGLAVTFQHTAEAMAAFYELHCRTRRRHGLPPQPWRFFEKVYAHVVAAGKGVVLLAAHAGKTVAGAVYFFYRDRALFKFGASDRAFQHLRANNLVMWEAIQWFVRNGFRSLHFGRSETENEGLLQFKRGWGAQESRVAYYRLSLRENTFSAERNGTRSSYPVFKMLPIPVLRIAGNLLYRHVG